MTSLSFKSGLNHGFGSNCQNSRMAVDRTHPCHPFVVHSTCRMGAGACVDAHRVIRHHQGRWISSHHGPVNHVGLRCTNMAFLQSLERCPDLQEMALSGNSCMIDDSTKACYQRTAIAYETRQGLILNRTAPGVSFAVSVNRLGVHWSSYRKWGGANEG